MPSPFPGMDPYLEHPLWWPSLQQHFTALLADTLKEVLPQRYLVRTPERMFLEPGDEQPVAGGRRSHGASPSQQTASSRQGSGIDIDIPAVVATAPEEIRETSVEIVQADAADHIITSIEFLTLLDKTPESHARRLYRQRQRETIERGAHLLEIDLLRVGQHTILPPPTRILRQGRYDYVVSLCREERRDVCEVWGVVLRQRLPKVALPLAEGETDLILDMQSLLDHCYEAGGFARRVDYEQEPFFPLSPAKTAWAGQVLSQEPRTK